MTLSFGPISGHTVHLCIDMQNVFAETTPWHTPWMARVLPAIEEIAGRHPGQTVFTRFIPPAKPRLVSGTSHATPAGSPSSAPDSHVTVRMSDPLQPVVMMTASAAVPTTLMQLAGVPSFRLQAAAQIVRRNPPGGEAASRTVSPSVSQAFARLSTP